MFWWWGVLEPDDHGLSFWKGKELVERQGVDDLHIVGFFVEVYRSEDIAHIVKLYITETL